jgi:hypothetical protein
MQAEPTAVLWLVDLPNVIRIRNVAASQIKGTLLEDKHTQRLFPNQIALDMDTVQQTLEDSGIKLSLDSNDDPVCVRALIYIAADEIHHELKPLTRHQRLHRDFFARLSFGKSNVGHQSYFKVLGAIAFKNPIELPALRQDRCLLSPLPGPFVLDLFGDLTDIEHELPVLPEWHLRVSRWCLRAARPFATLVAKGFMKSLSVCNLGLARDELRGCQSFVVGWPDDASVRRSKRSKHQDDDPAGVYDHQHELEAVHDQFPPCKYSRPSEELLTTCATLDRRFIHQTFECVRDLIRCMDASGTVVPHDVLQHLHDHALGWQAYADRLAEFEATRLTVQAYNKKYSIITLIHAFLACGYLKNDGQFRDACQWMLRACLPKDIAEHMVKHLISQEKDRLRLPSKATISRMRGRVDTAWMLTFRSILHNMIMDGGVVMYPMVDSSPQAGRDYEMLVVNIVAAKFLAELHVDIIKLEQRRLK